MDNKNRVRVFYNKTVTCVFCKSTENIFMLPYKSTRDNMLTGFFFCCHKCFEEKDFKNSAVAVYIADIDEINNLTAEEIK